MANPDSVVLLAVSIIFMSHDSHSLPGNSVNLHSHRFKVQIPLSHFLDIVDLLVSD